MSLNYNLSSPNSHAVVNATDVTALPLTLVIWVASAGGQTRRFLYIGNSADSTQLYSVNLNISASNNLVSAYVTGGVSGASANQALSTSGINTTSGVYNHCAAVFSASNARSAYLNGANKGNSTGAQTAPTGLDSIAMSGRPWDYAFTLNGQGAHAAIYNRALTDDEVAYLGANGGNPRAIKGLVHYYICYTGETTTLTDRKGTSTYNLAVSNATGNATWPDVTPYATGTVGALSYTQGTAITQIDLSTTGSIFEDPGNAYTVQLMQINASSAASTTTNGAGTTARQVVLTSAASFSAGQYVSINSGTKTRVLYVNAGTNTITVKDDQTWTNGQSVAAFNVSSISISGLGISSNKFSGTPTVNGTWNATFFRATNVNNSALVGDTELENLVIAAGGGGGGGSGLINSAGAFCGGFQG